jgi:hypothetical protein
MAADAIVLHGVGPRLRIYALYGDDAVDGDNASESPLSWVPTDGDWRMSIPCQKDDLVWVNAKLRKSSVRVTARALGDVVGGDEENDRREQTNHNERRSLDLDAFFRR